MTSRRRIPVYFDLDFEQDRRLFSRLAPYMRRKRANEIIKLALHAWLEQEKRRQEQDKEPGAPVAVPVQPPVMMPDAPEAPEGVPGAADGGIRDLVEPVETAKPTQSPAPRVAQALPFAPSPAAAAPDAPVGARPRLGRLM